MVDVERWLSYKGTCHVIYGMYLYKTDSVFHIKHYLKSVLKVALLHRFYCIQYNILSGKLPIVNLVDVHSGIGYRCSSLYGESMYMYVTLIFSSDCRGSLAERKSKTTRRHGALILA